MPSVAHVHDVSVAVVEDKRGLGGVGVASLVGEDLPVGPGPREIGGRGVDVVVGGPAC